jgi:type IV fimbrial biogenesis protein FimT
MLSAAAPRRATLRGVTLIELIVAIGIVAIGLALAAPSLSTMTASFRVRSSAESIVNGLSLARAEAVRRNGSVSFNLVGAATAWDVRDSASAVLHARAAEESTGLTAASGNAATAVTFLPTGMVDTSGTWMTSITVSSAAAGAESRRIDILGGGLVRMCDPSVATANDPRRC